MKNLSIKRLVTFGTIGMLGVFVAQTLLVAQAGSVGPITFETGTYTIGSINGQDGWGVTGPYDQGVVAAPGAYPTFGSQSLRISDAVTSGSFGDQIFAKPLADSAGETAATAGTFPPGTKQPHFEMQFDIASTQQSQQPGMHVSISPDRGDGSRMSYLRFEDGANGIDVFFDDVNGTSNPANFTDTQIASGLARSVPHTIKLTADFLDGPSNDVVKVYIDGVLVHTGTSWENYYLFDSEASAEQSSRIVKTVLFRESGTANSGDAGKGFLFDNLSLSSGPIPETNPNQVCTPINLVSGTNTQTAGETNNNPTTDVNGILPTSYLPGTFTNAVPANLTPTGFTLVPGGPWIDPSVDPNFTGSGAVWISTVAAAPGDGGEGLSTEDQWRLFESDLTVPADAIVSPVTLNFTADNGATAYFNGVALANTTGVDTYGTVPDPLPGVFGSVFTTNFTPVPGGPNKLQFVVRNSAFQIPVNPTGLLYSAQGQYCEPVAPPVDACPQGTNPVLLETDTVNSASMTPTPSSNTLLNGGTYLLVSSGVWQNSLNLADTEYTTIDNWSTHMNGYDISPYLLGEGEFDLQVNGAFINWGSYDSGHTYSHLYAGTGSPVNLSVFDGDSNTGVPNPAWYGDNSGNLTVNIYSCDPKTPPPPATVTVTLVKYVDGQPATANGTNGALFPMSATWNAENLGAGTGGFPLGPVGFNNPNPYQATTADMTSGASYSAEENLPTTCDAGNPYQLVGYTTGNSLQEAAAVVATSTVVPSLTNLTQNAFIVVWNKPCPAIPQIKVHILKYLDGQKATADTVPGGYQFPMVATWKTANLDGGISTSGNYVLGNNHGGALDLYGADTAPMQAPADYTTNEIIDGTSQVVSDPASCSPGKYLLNGYKTSLISFDDAATNGQLSTTAPVFSQISADQYVIVDNSSCPTTGTLTVYKYTNGGDGTFSLTGDGNLGTFDVVTTGGTGSKVFDKLAPGNYTITEPNVPSGWQQTDNDCINVAVAAGATETCTVTNTKIGTPKLGEIRGAKLEDRKGDGKLNHGFNRRLSGWTIYLDINHNGSLDPGEPSTVTNKSGEYRFKSLPAGTYYVREVGQNGWIQTYPTNGYYTVNVVAGKIVKKINFGNFKLGSISGIKFNDANANGRKDKDEVGLPDWTINLKGPNGVTASTVTASDGTYSFGNLGPGTYTLSEVMKDTWRQTAHPGPVKMQSGGAYAKENFGNTQKPIIHDWAKYWWNWDKGHSH